MLAALALERLAQRLLGALPLLVGADGLVRPRGELDAHPVEPEARIQRVDRRADRVDLVSDLVERAVDVGVVRGEAPAPEEAVQPPLALVSRDEPEFREP